MSIQLVTMSSDRLKRVRREVELQQLRSTGPRHGRSGVHRSKKDRAKCPRLQRKKRNWD